MGRNGFIRVPRELEKGRQWENVDSAALGAEKMVGRPAALSSCPRELLTLWNAWVYHENREDSGVWEHLCGVPLETLHRAVVGPRQRGEWGMEAGQLWGRDGPISSPSEGRFKSRLISLREVRLSLRLISLRESNWSQSLTNIILQVLFILVFKVYF